MRIRNRKDRLKRVLIPRQAKIKQSAESPAPDGYTFRIKPWGYEYACLCTNHFDIWELRISKRSSTSSHLHHKKDALAVVLEGDLELKISESTETIRTGECRLIKKGTVHRLTNKGRSSLRILEIESPPDRHDLTRLEDSYGRTGLPYAHEHSSSDYDVNALETHPFFQDAPKDFGAFLCYALLPIGKKRKVRKAHFLTGIVVKKTLTADNQKELSLLKLELANASLGSFIILQGSIDLDKTTGKRGDIFVDINPKKITKVTRKTILISW